MRIGQLTEIYRPHINGVANSVSLHKRTLELWGHEVFVFTPGYEAYEDGESNVFRAPAIPLSDTGYHLSLGFPRQARDEIETMDVLHVHHPFLVGQYAVNVGKRHDIPIVFTNHSRYHIMAPYYIPLATKELARTVMEAYLPRFTNQCDLVIAPSPGTAQEMRLLGVTCPIEIVPNGIQVDAFRNPIFPQKRTDLGIGEDESVLISVGRIGPEKNLTFLIQAFEGICQLEPKARLLLVGDGLDMGNIREQVRRAGISDQVTFTGQVAYEQVPGYLAIADVFVIASTVETFGLVAVEAMATGLPVVGIASTGIGEVVEDGVSGLIVPLNLRAFVQATVGLLANTDLREKLARGALEVSKRYSVAKTSREILYHYIRLIEEHV